MRGRDLGGFVDEVRERLAPLEQELPPGTYFAYGGQFENQERAMARLAIAVENAVLLVAFFRQLYNEGRDAMDAVRTGCDLRLRPLLLTALTTLLGALPLAYATGPGAEIQQPVAFVVLGGLASSLLVTLVVLPAAWAVTTPRRR